jgi:hypothetical protein
MTFDRENRAEEEANRRRADRIDEARDGTDDDGLIGTADRAFESVIDPIVSPDPRDPDEAQRERIANDEASRNE